MTVQPSKASVASVMSWPLWDRVLTGFDLDDETINFGTRAIAENNGSLYEVCTVATIQSRIDEEQVRREPEHISANISASIQHSKLLVAIDKSIIIFDETCDKVFFSANFPFLISCYCISEDGFFLFTVLTTRTLCCSYMSEGKFPSMDVSMVPIPLNQTGKHDDIINIFFKKHDQEAFIILVSNIGAIYRFSFKNYSKNVKVASSNSNKNMAAECTADMQFFELFKGPSFNTFFDAVIDTSSKELSITMFGVRSVFMWPSKHNNFNDAPSFGYKKIKPLKGSGKMLCLRSDRVLSIMCPNTLLTLRICDSPVFDFTIIQHDDISHCEILFLTESNYNDAAYTLCLISYPDFEQKFEIDVSIDTVLFENLHNYNNIFYIEGITNENEIIDTFRIKTISESILEMRLARLLKKKQFDAAEIFAKQFALSMEPIYYSKAALFIEQLSPWAGLAPSSVNVDTLINNLDKIQDIQYIIEYCSKALIPDYVQMKQLYLYAQQRIAENMKEGGADNKLNIYLSVINDKLHKLETFHMIQDFKTDTLLHDNTTTKEWIRFSQANLLKECIAYLRMGQLKSASLIWTRHLPDIIKHVSVQTIRDILVILPEDMDPSSLWPWLVHFITTSLSLLPDAMDEIVSWGLNKLKYLEISHRMVWPEIGIDFVKQFIKLFKFEDNQQFAYFQQEYRYQNSVLKQLMFVLQALSEIQQLKVVYRLKVPLDIYIGSPVEAIYILLSKIHLDEIPDFANTFLERYMLDNNLQNDAVLSTYIQKTIKSYNWQFGEEATWERRVAIIIDLIHNLENRLEQTLEVLKVAPIPWSSTITTLAETSSNLDHSLSSKIKIEIDYAPIKHVSRKYGYTTTGINNIRINKLIISRIIKEDRESMIDDINVLTKNDQRLKQDTFNRCINARLNEGNLQKAMSIICHLENNIIDTLYCYEGVINYIVATFSFENAVTSLASHMEVLGCLEFKIHNLLARSKICPSHCSNIINTIRDLKSMYTLKKDYKIYVSLNDYRMRKLFVLQNYITKKFPDIEDNNLSAIPKKIIKIAELLRLEKSYAILLLLERTKKVNILQQLVSNDEDLNVALGKLKNINKICLAALQHPDLNVNTMEVVRNLSVSMLNTCENYELQSALLFYTCVNAYPNFPIECYSNVKQTSQSNWKLYTIYKDQAIFLDQRLLSLFKDAMSLYLHYSDQVNNDEIRNYTNEQIDELLNRFLADMKEIQLQYNDYSLLRIFKMFYFMYCSTSIKNANVLTEMEYVLSQLLRNLLRKLCSGQSFDLHLGLACLFILHEKEAYPWISAVNTSSQVDHMRHSIISILGYEYSRLKKSRSVIQTFKKYKLLHIWAQRLSHYSITHKATYKPKKENILQLIINSNKENVISVLKDYCYDFKCDYNDCLLRYLKVLLKTWNPSITTSNITANNELLICKNEVDELKKKCDSIITQMENKSRLNQCISTLWDHIAFYNYEVFLILMDLVEDENMEKRNYLCFLQNYTRSGPPTSMEHDEWVQLNPGHSALPPIARWRLPFLPKIDVWKIITPELNLRTYNKWLDIAPVLNLETHLVCTLAIKGEVTHVWGDNLIKLKNATWSLHSKNVALLRDIRKCIQRITDSNGYYYGTAALYYVVNYTPPGADRVAAAKECYEYAQLAMKNSTKFEKGMLEKIKSKYLKFSSEHILRKYNLGIDKYLALIESPCKLVYELYGDESIPLRYRSVTDYRPDINAAVNELGKLFSLNTIKFRLGLLQEWLRSNPKYAELSQSFTETLPVLRESDQNTDHEDNLLRTCYMLEYGDTDLFTQFLISIGFGDHHGDVQYTYDIQYRALRVVQTILDTNTLEELTKRDISTFKKYMKSLQYIGKLESLGLCYNIDTFETCSKQELVQILWKNQHHSPRALSVITQICIDFGIQDVLFWNDALSQMTKLQMVHELKRILLHIRSNSINVNCVGYKMGWQKIISEPFRKMDISPSSEQINNCIEAICLLYSCSVAHELDFTAIVKHCFQCKQTHLAAALLPFLNEQEREFVLKIINQTCQITELREKLNNLSSKGVLTVAHSLAIVQKSIS